MKFATISIISTFFSIYFVLSFFVLTYSNNLYVVFSLFLLPFLLLIKLDKIRTLFLICFFIVFIGQLFFNTAIDAYRIIKTLIVLLPVFFFKLFSCNSSRHLHLLNVFLFLNVVLVYIDFILYYTIGTTLMPTKYLGMIPRIGALIEDSNFYSYLILSWSILFYIRTKRILYFFILSIFLSGSLSAVFTLLILSFFLGKGIMLNTLCRKIITLVTILTFSLYSFVVFYAIAVVEAMKTWSIDELLKIKIISMSHRFIAQNESLQSFFDSYNIFWGAGAGMTVQINSLGINMHNSYFQLLLESGLFSFLLVMSMIIYMGANLRDNRVYLLFCSIFLLGLIMEVLYFPLLSLIFFYGYTINQKEEF